MMLRISVRTRYRRPDSYERNWKFTTSPFRINDDLHFLPAFTKLFTKSLVRSRQAAAMSVVKSLGFTTAYIN